MQQLIWQCVKVCVCAARANRVVGVERVERIDKLQDRIVCVEVLTAVADEQGCMSEGASGIAMDLADELGRQAAGWARSAKKSVTATRQNPPAHATGGERIN